VLLSLHSASPQQKWALASIIARLPSLVGLVIAGWLMTVFTALDLNQRAVLRAFGNPQAFPFGLACPSALAVRTLKAVSSGCREIPCVSNESAQSATQDQLG